MEYHSKQEMLEDRFGRGAGDPDVHGHYPGDPDEKNCYLCNPGLKTPKVYRRKHWSEVAHNSRKIFGPREFDDNDPSAPEQAGF